MNFKWIGWCQEGSSDKVWAVCVLRGNQYFYHSGSGVNKTGVNIEKYATIWGRRGKSLQCKIFDANSLHEVDDKIRQKQNKNYVGIDQAKLDAVYPEFQSDLEQSAFWAMLQA